MVQLNVSEKKLSDNENESSDLINLSKKRSRNSSNLCYVEWIMLGKLTLFLAMAPENKNRDGNIVRYVKYAIVRLHLCIELHIIKRRYICATK